MDRNKDQILEFQFDFSGQALSRIFAENRIDLFQKKLVHLLGSAADKCLRVQQLKNKIQDSVTEISLNIPQRKKQVGKVS